jgi:hypothetical protein
MKSGRMRWAGHVARTVDKRKMYNFKVLWDVAPWSHVEVGRSFIALRTETVHVSLVRILMAVFDISHELEGYLLCQFIFSAFGSVMLK